LVGTHERPCVHVTQAPPLQTLSVAHGVPFGVLPDSMQTGAPVLHAVVPVRHALPATVQADPAMHATQVPDELQTLSVPHVPPAGTFIPVSTHVGDAPEQLSVPMWQALVAGLHASPMTHALQTPSWQTMPEPQGEPLGWLSFSVQTGEPVVHEMTPVRQGLFATSHAVPAEQAWQAPLTHAPLSQGVPLGWERCVSLHVGVLPLQTVSPTWQVLVGVHGDEGVHVVGASDSPSRGGCPPSIDLPSIDASSVDLPSIDVPSITLTSPVTGASKRMSETLTSLGAADPPSRSVAGRSGMAHPDCASAKSVAPVRARHRAGIDISLDLRAKRVGRAPASWARAACTTPNGSAIAGT
jgi:hypothetical protein